jgi:hypothetical protein
MIRTGTAMERNISFFQGQIGDGEGEREEEE